MSRVHSRVFPLVDTTPGCIVNAQEPHQPPIMIISVSCVPQENTKTPVLTSACHVLWAKCQTLAVPVAFRVLGAWLWSIMCAVSVHQALYTPARENAQIVQAIQIRLLVLRFVFASLISSQFSTTRSLWATIVGAKGVNHWNLEERHV